MKYIFFTLVLYFIFQNTGLGQNTFLQTSFKCSLNLEHKIYNAEIAQMEYCKILFEVSTFVIDSLKHHFDYQLVKDKPSDFTLLVSLWCDSTGSYLDKNMYLKYELINNSTKQAVGDFTYSNPKSEFEKRKKEKIKETAIKTISVIFHLKLPPHSYLASEINKENAQLSFSIDEYFECDGCENNLLSEIFTDLVSNMLVYKQSGASNHPKRKYFNFHRNYQRKEKIATDLTILGKIKILKSEQEIYLKLFFQSNSPNLSIFQPEKIEVKLIKGLIDKNNFTQFINDVNSIITSFYVKNL